MKIKSILNAIIIEVKSQNRILNFFLDSGCPVSFSKDIHELTNENIEDTPVFSLKLGRSMPGVGSLEQLLGIELSGFLGLDFISSFDYFQINIKEQLITFTKPDAIDYSLSIVQFAPIMTKIAIETPVNKRMALFDTGAYQNLILNQRKLQNPTMVSSEWIFPSAFGDMITKYFANVPVYIGEKFVGDFTYGVPSNLPNLTFDYVIGLNFISQFITTLDFIHRKIYFTKNMVDDSVLNHFDQDTFYLGFQTIKKNGNFVVSNVIDPAITKHEVNIGDIIEIENINDMNSFVKATTSNNTSREIHLLVNGITKVFITQPVFNLVSH